MFHKHDFIVYGAGGFWDIEVKNTATIRPADLQSLRTFSTDYPEARTILLYRGTERLRIGGILCMPCEQFLQSMKPGDTLSIE